jgi:hypothetical protein
MDSNIFAKFCGYCGRSVLPFIYNTAQYIYRMEFRTIDIRFANKRMQMENIPAGSISQNIGDVKI